MAEKNFHNSLIIFVIVHENSLKIFSHPEKLFNSIRIGWVMFYVADPDLELLHIKGVYLNMSYDNLLKREEVRHKQSGKINEIMFSRDLGVYSFKFFLNHT